MDVQVWPFKERDFYKSREWRNLRQKALKRYGAVCMKCGSTENIECDHIKSRARFYHLRLKKWNMQTLCKPCNLEKGSIDSTDYRPLHWRVYWLLYRSIGSTVVPTIVVTIIYYLLGESP